MSDPLSIVFFGTYDTVTHPRVQVLVDGFRAHGHTVTEVNEPLGVTTAERLRTARQPWRAPILAAKILRAWARLWRRTRALDVDADIVVVGYLGQFDIHLATRLFDCPVVLDYMVGLGDTALDRRMGPRSIVARLLRFVDRRATGAADLVLVDTEAQATTCAATRRRPIVTAVGATDEWFADPTTAAGDPVGVIFFGLYTPLQGSPTIGAAIARLADRDDISFTMIGDGQDRPETEAAAEAGDARWIDWLDPADLAAEVARHHICLGVFGTTPKAARVVPNKVFQGAAAGCAVITGDSPSQRAAFADAAVYVPFGDAVALADAVARLADDRNALERLRRAAFRRAVERFGPSRIVDPLDTAIRELLSDLSRV
ncbi:MAG: glycosyltransferase [Acidimicrobiia bacterium]|nr:glycosyltransferase [Acidimicrobiia bacterium]